MDAENKRLPKPDPIAQSNSETIKRLVREAKALKKLSELQSLKVNPRDVSVDMTDLLSTEPVLRPKRA